MTRLGYLTMALLIAISVVAQESPKERIAPCKIAVGREAQEAVFTVVYKFEVVHGRPSGIRRVMNDFLPDADFVSCISEWRLPSLRGTGAAEFSYRTGEGWTEIVISGKNFKRQIPLSK